MECTVVIDVGECECAYERVLFGGLPVRVKVADWTAASEREMIGPRGDEEEMPSHKEHPPSTKTDEEATLVTGIIDKCNS